MTKQKRISLKEIAALAEVSTSTVSNVLNNKNCASPSKSEMIKRIARDAGYKAKKESKRNQKQIRFLICKRYGVVLDTPFFSTVIEGIENKCKAHGYEMLFTLYDVNDNSFCDIIDTINQDDSTGLLVLATELDREDFKCFEHLRKPVVFVDGYCDGMDYDFVLINNIDAAYKATDFLIKKGHKRIGYLHGAENVSNVKYRKIGFLNALTENGLQIDPRNEFSIGLTLDGAYKDMEKLLRRLQSRDLPEAFFADNDNIAISAIKFFTQNGLKIPEDISIIGMDDVSFSAICTPPLTTIRVPREDIASISVNRLIRRIINNDNCTQKIEVSSRLVERGSVASKETYNSNI